MNWGIINPSFGQVKDDNLRASTMSVDKFT